MLSVDPNKRLTIDEVMKNNWIAQYTNVPQTPLHTNRILREEEQQWPEVQEEMNRWDCETTKQFDSLLNETFCRSLASMRVDPGLHLKNLDNSSNALLNKRKKAKGADNNAGGGGESSYLTKF